MTIRDFYLKIEQISSYSPVHPVDKEPPGVEYSRDCMYGEGHENGKIPQAEVDARTLDAIVYREYLDKDFLIPKPDKMVESDINEPVFDSRIGTVLYASPGQTLNIHVLNADNKPHSFHIHGLEFGIDSDGAWPFGTQNEDGSRSDRICPGEKWTYIFNVREEMIGVWPFHDHFGMVGKNIDRGLFGGLIVQPKGQITIPELEVFPREFEDLLDRYVRIKDIIGEVPQPRPRPDPPPIFEKDRVYIRDQVEFLKEWLGVFIGKPPKKKRKTLHVPLFFHKMKSHQSKPVFDTGDIEELGGEHEVIFNNQGAFDYFCIYHPMMEGKINVVPGGSLLVTVNILDNPQMGFYPPIVDIGIGGTVKWVNQSQFHHTATSKEGASLATHCFNGRGFVGNSPTIVAESGQKIKWYVFNLDVGHEWHNFHTHSQRWKLGNENIDVRSLGPAESFAVETTAPPVLLFPDKEMNDLQECKVKPKDAKIYRLKGDFVFHCHVHHHMMNGMVGLVRSFQNVWLTPDMITKLKKTRGFPLDDGTNNCPTLPESCSNLDLGRWEEIPGDPEVTLMHSVLLPKTQKVLYWGYTRADQSRLWDYGTNTYSSPVNQPASLPGENENTSNLWSAEHSFLDDTEGTALIHGGLTQGPNGTPTESFLFSPSTLQWSKTNSTTNPRFYSTTITLADGKLITLYGSSSKSIEVYTPGAGWGSPINLPYLNYRYYPWTFLLPDGRLFIAGPESPTHRFDWQNPIVDPNNTWNTNEGTRDQSSQNGTAVIFPLRPPNYEPRVMIMGGRNPNLIKSSETIDLSLGAPSWSNLSDMNEARGNLTSVLLPDGRVFVAGGIPGAPGVNDGGPSEIFDPQNPNDGWQLGPIMKYPRNYHSSMILLPDGSILAGGDPRQAGNPTPHERYYPGYFNKTRPQITNIPNTTVNYGNNFDVQTPNSPDITEVVLMYPGAVTHSFNMTQRIIECEIVNNVGGIVRVKAPTNGNIAPPGHYLVFILDANRIPSTGEWIRLRN
ncbi:MAG: DUF1929 domain-containing protein [Nitrosopumilus sp.]|nr:DUF1929 domain-containing protein [Nitrosopumilus sp.]